MQQPLLTTDFLDRAVDLYGDDIGIVADDRTEFTYAEVGERVDRLSNALREWGVEKGDRVALLSPNSHYLIETLYATMQLGALYVPLNFRLQPAEYDYLLNDCDPTVVIADYEYAEKLQHLKAGGDTRVEEWVAYDADDVDGAWHDYETVLDESSAEQPERPEIDESDDATILYTSGTTGDPKGVVHTRRIQHYHAMIHAHHVEFEDNDTLLWTSPMFYINGWGHIYGLTGIGGKHVILRDFDPGAVFERVHEYDVSFLGGAPTVLNLLLEHHQEADVPTTGEMPVRVETAASPPPKQTIRRTEDELGWRIIHAYGATETGPLITTSNSKRKIEDGDKYDIINKPGFATLNTRIRVVDEDGEDVPLDDETKGEVVARGNQLLDRYWNKPEKTEAAFHDRVDGWFHTGDIATMDENKMITIVDRKKDISISGGENISSIEVQDTNYDHPAVTVAAVIGVPHETWGETLKALVVDRRCFRELTVEENLRLAANHARDPLPVAAVLDRFPELEDMVDRPSKNMSGGEQQMLAIARSLVTNPKLILLDGPCEGLAPYIVRRIESIIKEINDEQDVSVLLVEQNVAVAMAVAERHYVLDEGEIVEQVSTAELREDEALRQEYLGV